MTFKRKTLGDLIKEAIKASDGSFELSADNTATNNTTKSTAIADYRARSKGIEKTIAEAKPVVEREITVTKSSYIQPRVEIGVDAENARKREMANAIALARSRREAENKARYEGKSYIGRKVFVRPAPITTSQSKVPATSNCSSTPISASVIVERLNSSVPTPTCLLKLFQNPKLQWVPGEAIDISRLSLKGSNEYKIPAQDANDDARELTLGLDFGTSSVKVVIGDKALDMAFAVPFKDITGISGFLLPGYIYQAGSSWSLLGGESIFRNLKLDLIANLNSLIQQRRVVAFLAFVMRHSRAWMMEKYGAEYSNTDIYWSVRIGLPVANHLDTELKNVFEYLGRAAWILSFQTGDKFDDDQVLIAMSRAKNKLDMEIRPAWDEPEEVTIIPEIAAQIFGYVSSEGFDPQARNVFMLVDVGAGTVDTSIFRVTKNRGKVNFQFITSSVEPNGTMNLNQFRLQWWLDELNRYSLTESVPSELRESIKDALHITDSQVPLPNSIKDYVSSSFVKFTHPEFNPDEVFFYERLSPQIRGKTFLNAWKNHSFSQTDLKDMPTYLCGGGMKMPYYQKLSQALEVSDPNCSWLRMKTRKINIPKQLRVEGLPQSDYDRLSVAYGLSLIDVGTIHEHMPEVVERYSNTPNYHDYYVDKDQV